MLGLLASLFVQAAAAQEYPVWLPPAAEVKHALEALPQLRASRAAIRMEEANAARLQTGPQEWVARTGVHQRNERTGPNYLENEIAFERPVRFADKAEKDRALGENGIQVADAAMADSWHEAARALMTLWFNWLREDRSAQRLQDYAQVLARELQIVQQRVKAGDAPRVEMMLAETELAKAVASQQQAVYRAGLIAADIGKKFPGIVPILSASLPAPLPLDGDSVSWQEKILKDNHEIELADLSALQEKLFAERIALEQRPDPTFGVRMAQERGGSERIFGLSLSIPLPGQYRRQQTAVALARSQIARERAAETRIRVESTALQVAQAAGAARALWQRLADVAEQTQANAALVSRAYALGEAPLADTLLARRHAIEALGTAEQMQIDALQSRSQLLLDTHAIWSLHEGHEHP
jgi:outer membrane protein TolC